MKKHSIGIGLFLLALFSFSFLVKVSEAATLSDAQIQAIISLVRSFGAEEAVLKNVEDSLYGRAPSVPPPLPPITSSFCYTFTRYLAAGVSLSKEEARALGFILKKEGVLYSSDVSAFNDDVAAAVVGLQEKYGIKKTGTIGPITRAQLNSLYGCSAKGYSITLSPGNDYYFTGAGSLREISDGGFADSQRVGNRIDELLTVDGIPPAATESASGVYYRWQGAWRKVGLGSTIIDQNTIITRYFVIRKNSGESGTFRLASHNVYYGSTVKNGTPRPWDTRPQPSITVLSPNGGEQLVQGQPFTFRWSAAGLEKVSIWLHDGSYNYSVATGISAASGSYVWNVPSTMRLSSTYTAYIGYPVGGATVADGSDSYFTITAPNPSITVSAGVPIPHGLAVRGSVKPFTRIVLAPSNGTPQITGITVRRDGNGHDAAFERIILYRENNKGHILAEGTLNIEHQAFLRFYEPFSLSSTETLTIAGVMKDDLSAYAGLNPILSVVSIVSPQLVTGVLVLPIAGNVQTINNSLNIGRLQYAFSPSQTSFSALPLENGSVENIRLEGIILKNHGGAVSIGNDSYTCAAGVSSRGDLCVINRVIAKGETITVRPASGAGQMLDPLHIIAIGELYGFHIVPRVAELTQPSYTLTPGKTYFFKLPGGAQLLSSLDSYVKDGQGFVRGSVVSADQIQSPTYTNGTFATAIYYYRNIDVSGGTGWRSIFSVSSPATSTPNQYIAIKKLATGGRVTEWVPPAGTIYYGEGVSSGSNVSWFEDFKRDYPAPSANKPPYFKSTAPPAGPSTVTAGTSGTWTFYGGDPDGTSVTYTASFGDNTAEKSEIVVVAPNTTKTFTVTHAYQTPGTYTLTFRLTDAPGASATATKTVEVTAPVTSPPAAPVPLLISGGTTGTLTNNFSGWVGFQFRVSSSPISVTALGRHVVSGSSGAHQIKLINADGTDIPGATVTVNLAGVAGGSYAYGLLSSPVTLQANTVYSLVSQEFGNGDQWRDYVDNPITLSSDATPVSAIWAPNNTTTYTFVTNSAGTTYVPVNLKYAKIATSSPVTLPQARRISLFATVVQALRNLLKAK